jgi:hypothetical protein
VSIKATTGMGNLTFDTLHNQEFYQLFFSQHCVCSLRVSPL